MQPDHKEKFTRKNSAARKRRKASKPVKYWTLITIDSENCDPKRLTPRQQLAYIAKRAQGPGSQLMSDFRPSDYGSQILFSDNQTLCREEFGDYDESNIIMSATTQERINADLRELAAASIIPHSSVADAEELLELAEKYSDDSDISVPVKSDRTDIRSQETCSQPSYLAEGVAVFLEAVSAIQARRLSIFEADKAARKLAIRQHR